MQTSERGTGRIPTTISLSPRDRELESEVQRLTGMSRSQVFAAALHMFKRILDAGEHAVMVQKMRDMASSGDNPPATSTSSPDELAS